MIFDETLSKREKFLIFVLSIVLIIFLYFNFIREPIMDKIKYYSQNVENLSFFNNENLKIENEKLNYEIINFTDMNNYKDVYNKYFISGIDVFKLANSFGLNFDSSTTSSINRELVLDSEINYIESKNYIEGNLSNISEFINEININENLFIEEIDLTRKGKNLFGLYLVLRQYTLENLPYTGIVPSENKKPNGDNSSLIDHLYGENKTNRSEETSNISIEKEKKTTDNQNKNSDGISRENVKEQNSATNASLTHSTINYSTYYEEIDVKTDKVLSETYLNEYSKENNVDLIIKTDYFKENEELFNSNSQYIEAIKFDNKSGQIEVFIENELNLKDAPILIKEPKDFYAFEFKTIKEGKVYLQMKTSDESVVTIQAKKQNEDWEVVEFKLPEDDNSYPIKIFNLSVEDDSGANYGIIRNFAGFNEK